MARWNVIWGAIGCLAVAGGAGAQDREPVVPIVEEFLIGEEVFPRRAGETQLTAGIDYGYDDHRQHLIIPALVEYGLTDRLQLEAKIPFEIRDTDPGDSRHDLNDLSMGALYNVYKELRPFALAVFYRQFAPTGDEDEGIGRDTWVGQPGVVVGRPAGSGEVHAGLRLDIGGGTDVTFTLAALYPWYPLRFGFEMEATDAENRVWRIAPVLYYRPKPDIALGVGVPLALNEDTPELGLLLNASMRFYSKSGFGEM